MRYRVIKSFLDKNTRKPYNADYFYETDNETRASELIAGGYIIPLGNAKKATNEAANENATETNASESDTENNAAESAAAETAAESDEAKKKTTKK